MNPNFSSESNRSQQQLRRINDFARRFSTRDLEGAPADAICYAFRHNLSALIVPQESKEIPKTFYAEHGRILPMSPDEILTHANNIVKQRRAVAAASESLNGSH